MFRVLQLDKLVQQLFLIKNFIYSVFNRLYCTCNLKPTCYLKLCHLINSLIINLKLLFTTSFNITSHFFDQAEDGSITTNSGSRCQRGRFKKNIKTIYIGVKKEDKPLKKEDPLRIKSFSGPPCNMSS